ncbi:uncharacterized protein EI90DRAFT_2436486 [Cantharellus anzutake]|uniref:uncharacterized protein n=1 Tax=Cantharellus anzutake TaxID=1750568 RepID=UPI0019040EE1|nr:uncharacterized protein EI90DRAFT_2436486 [Cantharellus anzutake]KAF8338983.1 hypothetical protein EI90DRAFT_2436486 [Cantharellus anzutake]
MDPRFSTNTWDEDDLRISQPEISSILQSQKEGDSNAGDDEALGETDGADPGSEVADDGANITKSTAVADLAAFNDAQAKSGVVYISRIPPGMGPAKVRQLLSIHGDLGRVFLQKDDAKGSRPRQKRNRVESDRYTEGWVEFRDKRIARTVAEILNGQPMGVKIHDRFRYELWMIKYLPRFKWNMLTEQMAHERASRVARLRHELVQSKKEQSDYLEKVESARRLNRRGKQNIGWQREAEASPQLTMDVAETDANDPHTLPKKKEKAKAVSSPPTDDIDNILGSIF